MLEAFVVEYLLEDTLTQWRPGGQTGTAVLWNAKKHDIVVDDASALQAKVDACCNHLSCAVSCVRLGLHRHCQLTADDSLRKSINEFERTIDCADREQDPWARLVHHDAPRVLGNIFCAVIAAVLFDCNWRQAQIDLKDVIQVHVKACLPAVESAHIQMVERCASNTTVDELLQVVRDGTSRQVLAEIVGCPPPPNDDDAELPVPHHLNTTFELLDVHMLECLPGHNLVISTSPRVAKMQCAYLANGRYHGDDAMSTAEDLIVTHSEEPQQASEVETDHMQQGEGQAVYCEDCETWLNSLTQWGDHKIGKKHKKNCKNRNKRQNKKSTESRQDFSKMPHGAPAADLISMTQWEDHKIGKKHEEF